MTPARDSSGAGENHTCVLASDPLAVRAGLARIAAAPPLLHLTADQRGTVEVVLAEVLNNIAEHAYAGGLGQITVSLCQNPAGISCQIRDEGASMPGARLPSGDHPAQLALQAGRLANVPLSDLPEGGFGWHLIRHLTKDLNYVRDGGQNHLSFLIPLQWNR